MNVSSFVRKIGTKGDTIERKVVESVCFKGPRTPPLMGKALRSAAK